MERRLYNHHHGMHSNDHPGFCIYIATPAEILAAAANLDGAEPDYEAAAQAMYAEDDAYTLPWEDELGAREWYRRMTRIAVDAALAGHKVIPLPDKETPNE